MIKHSFKTLGLHRHKENAKTDFYISELNNVLLNILQKLTTRQNVQK